MSRPDSEMNDVMDLTEGHTQILLPCSKVNSLLNAEFCQQLPLS
jgi:hypothetical protein